MKIFISWSGERSKAVANLFKSWIKSVLQNTDPWCSTHDIAKGDGWFSAIRESLDGSATGIVCVTQENKDRPWLLFEAGALAKGLESAHVMTFLIDLQPKDIQDPLAQFNHTFPTRADILAMMRGINTRLGPLGLAESLLDDAVETWWPKFETGFAEAMKIPAHTAVERTVASLLEEILENTRQIKAAQAAVSSRRPTSVPVAALVSNPTQITGLDRNGKFQDAAATQVSPAMIDLTTSPAYLAASKLTMCQPSFLASIPGLIANTPGTTTLNPPSLLDPQAARNH